jgi:hypothetical protein
MNTLAPADGGSRASINIFIPETSMTGRKASAHRKRKVAAKKTLSEIEHKKPAPATAEFIRKLRGSCKSAGGSLVEAREREHRLEKTRMSE